MKPKPISDGSKITSAPKLMKAFSDLMRVQCLIVSIILVLILASCQANVRLAGTLTDRGVINRSNLDLGNAYLWDRAQSTITRINKIDAKDNQLTPPTAPVNSSVSLTSGATFAGGVTLTSEEQADLEAEVTSRSGIVSKDLSTTGLRNPTGALLDAINADPKGWFTSLGLGGGNYTLAENQFLVLVYDVSNGKSLNVTVDKKTAVGGTFKSNTIKTASGNLKFKIVDAATLEITSVENSTTLFARLAVYKTSPGGENGFNLRLISDKKLMSDLANTFVSGG